MHDTHFSLDNVEDIIGVKLICVHPSNVDDLIGYVATNNERILINVIFKQVT
jgi:hypothetical protein